MRGVCSCFVGGVSVVRAVVGGCVREAVFE